MHGVLAQPWAASSSFQAPAQDWGPMRGLWGHPPVLEPRKRAGHLAIYPLRSLPWASVSAPGRRGPKVRREQGGWEGEVPALQGK